MFNVNYLDTNVNCTIWCTEALSSAGVTDTELKEKAQKLQKPGERILIRKLERYGDVEIYLEYENLTTNMVKTYRFVKKTYANCTYTYYSVPFTM